MTIVYSLVARGKIVLAEYTATSGNFPTITRVLLGKIPDQNGKMSYVYDQYIFHYIIENHLIYMCMCDNDSKDGGQQQGKKLRIPFAFLETIKNDFITKYGARAQTAIAFALNDEFSKTLQRQMELHNSPSADQISQVGNKIEDVKNVMVQNIELVLERGEKIELLVDKSEQLQQQAFRFHSSSRQLKNTMIWRRVQMYLLIALIVAIIVWIISSLICGFDYKKCQSK